jgi:hypothetical protein
MATKVQVRLDEAAEAALELLQRRGLSTSEVLRKGIHLMVKEVGADKPIEIIGLGKYDSGIKDLSTNKRYMEGFGGHSKIKGRLARRTKGR